MKLENVSQNKATTSKINKTKIHLYQSQSFLADEIERFTKKQEHFLGFFSDSFFVFYALLFCDGFAFKTDIFTINVCLVSGILCLFLHWFSGLSLPNEELPSSDSV